MRHLTLCLLLVAAITAPAAAEPTVTEPPKIKNLKVRVFGASAPKIGCTHYVMQHCEGLERYRIGMGVSEGALLDDTLRVGPVVMYQVVSRQTGSLLASQAIAAIGIKKLVGGGWVQGGLGIARTRIARGPRSVGILHTIGRPRPAMVGGIGMNLDLDADEPASISLDVGSTIDPSEDGAIFQVAASMIQRF